MNTSIFRLLSGSTYTQLTRRLKKSMKGHFNIKSKDNKCFLWCHNRHLNPLNTHPEKITKVVLFCYENNLVYPVYV